MIIHVVLMALSAAQAPCPCPASVGAEAGATPLIFVEADRDRPGLVVCGYLEARGTSVVKASEFDVFECGSNRSLLTFGAVQTADLELQGDTLLITETERWPFGE